MGTNRQLVDAVWEAVEVGDLDRWNDILTEDVEQRGPGWDVRGIEASKELVRGYMDALPDLRHEIVNVVEAGNQIAVELRITGTHTGPLVTPEGVMGPTGRSLELRSCDMITVRDGRIASWRAYFDQLSFLGQLGLVPEHAA